MTAAVHLHELHDLTSGRRFTACGLVWAEIEQGRNGGRVLRFVRDAVDDPKAADCRVCLRRAKKRKGKKG